jgi:uncharacterized protein (DUF1015 family)
VAVATLRPFRALRPNRSAAPSVAAVPYDVVNADEARELAADNPLSFLRVSRAELELPPGTDPYSNAVYDRAAANFDKLKSSSLVVEAEPSAYFYRLRVGDHEQTGVGGCYALDEYDCGVIKKHERTRPDKEDDRTRHMMALGAQTGPVFLIYRESDEVDSIRRQVTAGEPLCDFRAPDAVHHTVWQVRGADRDRLVVAFSRISTLYIADGHHRAASAARTRDTFRDRGVTRPSLGDAADYTTFLAVSFPHDEVQVLPYNRIVKSLGRLTPDAFIQAVRDRFELDTGPAAPARRGDISMYFGGGWHTLRPRSKPDAKDKDALGSLDVSVLQDQLLSPVLGIADVTTDKRIDFVGGARGTIELETLVRSGKAAVAFSMYPVSVADLMAVCDAAAIMPPKSTWFEPKLRDGLLIHLI